MTITFPNCSRSYDATRRAVRFWGYDRSMESSFFIMSDALKKIQPTLRFDAVDILRTFDVNRERIYAIAAKVYAEDTGALTISTWLTFEIDSALTAPSVTAARRIFLQRSGRRCDLQQQ